MITAYGEPDRITIAGAGDLFGSGMSNLMSGNLLGTLGNAVPFSAIHGNSEAKDCV